jgi:hypothetical protein
VYEKEKGRRNRMDEAGIGPSRDRNEKNYCTRSPGTENFSVIEVICRFITYIIDVPKGIYYW